MRPIVYREELNVRFSDLDPYGHVNSSIYLDYVVSARFMFVQKRFGLDEAAFAKRGVGFYVTRAEIVYKRPIPGVRPIVVTSRVTNLGTVSATASFEIQSPDEKTLYASGTFDFAFVDLREKRPVPCPDWVRGILVEEVEEEEVRRAANE